MRAQKGELTAWNDMPVCGRSHPNRATSGFPQSFCGRCWLLPCYVPPSHPVGVTYCEKNTLGPWDGISEAHREMLCLPWMADMTEVHKRPFCAWTWGQNPESYHNKVWALGPFIYFSGSLVAICHLSGKKVESARGFFLAMVGWCLPMTWDLSVFNQLVHRSQIHVGYKRLLLQTVQTLPILLMFPGVDFGTWLPK